jgi:hypothetical protein
VIIAASIQNLILTAVCTDNPDAERRWRITNPNPFPIEVEWGVYKTAQRGTVTAQPGYTYFSTNTEKGSNTTVISWKNDFYTSQVDMKASSKKICESAEGGLTARLDNGNDGVETDSPFIIDVWPNPTHEKFSIMIASPFEEPVELEILGLHGERVFSTQSNSNMIVEVDATRYPAGMYLIKAKQLMFNQTLKLIKQ